MLAKETTSLFCSTCTNFWQEDVILAGWKLGVFGLGFFGKEHVDKHLPYTGKKHHGTVMFRRTDFAGLNREVLSTSEQWEEATLKTQIF